LTCGRGLLQTILFFGPSSVAPPVIVGPVLQLEDVIPTVI
jgi:hypothetical protein